MKTLIKDYITIFSAVLLIVSLLYNRWDKSIETYRAELLNNVDRRELLKKLVGYRSPWLSYLNSLGTTNKWLDRYYFASKKHGGLALYRCLIIAFLYPVVFLITVWAFDGNTRILSSYYLMPPVEHPYIRIFTAVVIFVSAISLYLLIFSRKEKKSQKVANKKLLETFSIKRENISISKNVYFSFEFLLAFGIIFVPFGVHYFFESHSIVFFFYVLIISVVFFRANEDFRILSGSPAKTPRSLILAIACMLPALIIYEYFFMQRPTIEVNDDTGTKVFGIGSRHFIYYTFLFILPLANAVFDWLSWGVTRFLLRKAAGHARKLTTVFLLLFELIIDLIFALVCLAGLCITLAILFEHWNRFNLEGDGARVDWEYWSNVTRNDPFGDGVWLTLIIFSTFVPTVIHLTFGTRAIFLSILPSPREAIAIIKSGELTENSSRKVAKVLSLYDFLYVPAVVFAVLICASLIWVLSAVFPTVWRGIFEVILYVIENLY